MTESDCKLSKLKTQLITHTYLRPLQKLATAEAQKVGNTHWPQTLTRGKRGLESAPLKPGCGPFKRLRQNANTQLKALTRGKGGLLAKPPRPGLRLSKAAQNAQEKPFHGVKGFGRETPKPGLRSPRVATICNMTKART